mgnify:CR=1 FL=1
MSKTDYPNTIIIFAGGDNYSDDVTWGDLYIIS